MILKILLRIPETRYVSNCLLNDIRDTADNVIKIETCAAAGLSSF